MAQKSTQTKRIAFLDTNALLRLFDYWELCTSRRLRLDDCGSMQALKVALARSGMKLDGILCSPDLDPIRQGMDLFHASVARKDDWDMYTSCICMSEFSHTLLEQLAAERLVSQRIPYRLALKRPLVVFRRSLHATDYSKLESKVDSFFQDMTTAYDIPVLVAEKTETSLDVVSEAASQIWSRVLMDVMDTLIYASAVTSMANTLVTRDDAFKDTVNHLYHPPDAEWKSIRKSILLALAKVTRTYSLPEGRSVSKPYPVH